MTVMAALAATAVLALNPSPAAAADCSGTRVGHHPVRTSAGILLGYVDIYYDSSTGMNCARTNTYNGDTPYGNLYGVRKLMTIELWTCRETVDPGNSCTHVSNTNPRYHGEDSDYYRYYAGPVSVYGRGRCIEWYGDIVVPSGGTPPIGQSYGTGHCG